MTVFSIYHFWDYIVRNKASFSENVKLGDFKFDTAMLSCNNIGVFPDLAIRLNNERSLFTGGELIELKDSKTYVISSFNSTIPTGKKNIRKIIRSKNSIVLLQMMNAGDDVFSLEERDVYYMVRGRKREHQKICLVHGSFFETISVKDLIRQTFTPALEENNISDEGKERLNSIFSEQLNFSRMQNLENASVKLRFGIWTEVKPEGNILNSRQFPEIVDDSLNFVLPYHNDDEKSEIIKKMEFVLGKNGLKKFRTFSLKHPLNGWFIVFQTNL